MKDLLQASTNSHIIISIFNVTQHTNFGATQWLYLKRVINPGVENLKVLTMIKSITVTQIP